MQTKVVPIHKGIVFSGKLKLHNRDRFDDWMKGLRGDVEVIVRKPQQPRSLKENNYYWGVIIKMISEETGAFPDDAHYELKRMFLKQSGDKIPVLISTTDLSTTEFEEFLSKVRIWAASELGIMIPQPNECEINF